ncbi:hypothetical protein COLO4_36318 [Corchorus olitorius]|uniref:Uncharacterized protein n=1 Tax=Corchorus olitorius TaxID=93759 RepID=A0A1R3GA59_9ROSI|nr:hypothetical protein COLO4_36318 [Corchorus olitorius]
MEEGWNQLMELMLEILKFKKKGGRSQSTNGVAPSNSEFQNGVESVDGVATNVNSNNTSLTNPQKGKKDGVPQDITSTVRKHLNGVWPTWCQFPPLVKDSLWRRFKEKYCWDKDISETVYIIWYDKADRGFRDSMSRARKAACIAAGIDPNDYNADLEWIIQRNG